MDFAGGLGENRLWSGFQAFRVLCRGNGALLGRKQGELKWLMWFEYETGKWRVRE